MRRIWLLVIVLGIATAVVLSFTWQDIPYLREWVPTSPVIQQITDYKNQFMDTVRSNPQALLGLAGAGVTAGIGAVKMLNTRITEFRQARTVMNDTIGEFAGQASQLKVQIAEVTGQKEELIQEVSDLKQQLTEQAKTYADFDKALAERDIEIKRLRDQTDSLHEVIQLNKLNPDNIVVKEIVK